MEREEVRGRQLLVQEWKIFWMVSKDQKHVFEKNSGNWGS